MLKNLTGFFTSATAPSVAIRYISVIIGAGLAILSIFGLMTPEQVVEYKLKIAAAGEQILVITVALGGLLTLLAPIYATLTKSSSDKAAAAAKEIDEKLPKQAPVEIVTPGAAPNIIVPSTAK